MQDGGPSEADLMRKISGLLAKAEGTDNENEAKAFFEKAYELMAKHAVDEARIRAERKRIQGNRIEEPVVEDYMFSSYAHHAGAKGALFEMVAKAHSVHVFPYTNRKFSNRERVAAAGSTGLHESQWAKVVGYKDDIEMVKMLYLSLLIQSQRFANEDWRRLYGAAKHSSYDDGHIGKFSWMSTHMEGFAYRVGERFKELAGAIYASSLDGTELIRNKDADILEWMYEHGIMRRPAPPIHYCWASQPESDRPLTKAGTPSKKWEPAYCIKHNPAEDQPHEGPHAYTYRPVRAVARYSGGYGRRTSYEAGNIGRDAANRADIGQTRVGNTSRLINK